MEISVYVRNKEQYEIVKDYPLTRLYTNDLKLAKKDERFYYEVPRIYQTLKELPTKLLINDLGVLNDNFKTHDIVTNYSFNVANTKTIQLLTSYQVKSVILSLELSIEDIRLIKNINKYPVELYLYGRPLDMLLKRHPLFKENGYTLKNKTLEYPIQVDNGHVYIYHYESLNRMSDLSLYQKMGIQSFRVDFYDESKEEICQILNLICHNFTN